MIACRLHGDPPRSIAVVHGGPGANGEMAPVARALSGEHGILEPLQTALSVEGQVIELKNALLEHGAPPMILIGHSWGAWLAFIFAARYPSLVRKIILVAAPPFHARYVSAITSTRMSRLTDGERLEVESLVSSLSSDQTIGESAFRRIGELYERTDSFDLLDEPIPELELHDEIYRSVWPQANTLRKSGALLRYASAIRCPVVAIHGSHDPHPAAGVREPLAVALKDFRLILLEKCGHKPWRERQAKEEFYRAVGEEIGARVA